MSRPAIIISDEVDRAMWKTRLQEAQCIRHDVMMGKSRQSVGYNGEQVTWHKTDLRDLDAYIRDMQVALGLISNRRRVARGVRFG